MDPATEVRLDWKGGERFEGTVGASPIVIDGGSDDVPSPMQAVAAGIAGCMAIDVATILEKGRQPLDGLEVLLEADRAEEPPRRFVAIRLHFRVRGEVDPSRVERAIELSRTTYCSASQSLRQDVAFETSFEVVSRGD
jgi:putative redox protein